MRSPGPEYYPISGRTYSLFGESDSTTEYYETIRNLADKVLVMNPDTRSLIENIRRFSSKKRILKKSLEVKDHSNLMSEILNIVDPDLKKYTEKSNEHLRTLRLSQLWDRRLATTREQYHLYMLEIEL
jgi:hypothetical protein